MEILHTINILGVNIPLVEINLEEKEKRNSLVQKTPTATFPFLETTQGNISQSNSIINYLAFNGSNSPIAKLINAIRVLYIRYLVGIILTKKTSIMIVKK